MKISIDTGGTFTDLVLENDNKKLSVFKVQTTPKDPSIGILNGIKEIAKTNNLSLIKFLKKTQNIIHGTTHGINAILTNKTAKTAFLCTEGHPDTLLFREGGRVEIFNFTVEYPDPYVPRSLTFEIKERINYDGTISNNIDEEHLYKTILKLKKLNIEAVAICFLWSTINPSHEIIAGEMLRKFLPDIPYSLSHNVNPTLREYRRASSTCINASLKPIITKYLLNLTDKLKVNGFNGELSIVTSQGGIKNVETISEYPIHILNSGPSMAPVAGNFYLNKYKINEAIVTDLGGTTFDISLIKDNEIPRSRETWIGEKYRGHMTGFSSIDIRSIGAGGGSIAWIDNGGLLHVGPRSAGANPGPACYGLGGSNTTLTDAALINGILNDDYFLGGRIKLKKELSIKSIKTISSKLKMDENNSASSIIDVVTQNMSQEIKNLTIRQGINPNKSVIISGGGASGINIIDLARNLGCKKVLMPDLGPVLSASGGIIADFSDEYSITYPSKLSNLNISKVNTIIKSLSKNCQKFLKTNCKNYISFDVFYYIDAKFTDQVWEIEVPLKLSNNKVDPKKIKLEFQKKYLDLFGVTDNESEIEIIQWNARIYSKMTNSNLLIDYGNFNQKDVKYRDVFFKNIGFQKTKILKFEQLVYGKSFNGPAVLETPFTSVLVDKYSKIKLNKNNVLEIEIKLKNESSINEDSTYYW